MSLAELQLGLPGQLDLRGVIWLPPHVEPVLPTRTDRIAAHAAVGRAALAWARDTAAANPRTARAAATAMAAAAVAVSGRSLYRMIYPPPPLPDWSGTLPDELLADILSLLDERSALAAAMVTGRWRRVCRLLVTVTITPGLFGSPHSWGLGRLGDLHQLRAVDADARLLGFMGKPPSPRRPGRCLLHLTSLVAMTAGLRCRRRHAPSHRFGSSSNFPRSPTAGQFRDVARVQRLRHARTVAPFSHRGLWLYHAATHRYPDKLKHQHGPSSLLSHLPTPYHPTTLHLPFDVLSTKFADASRSVC